MDLRKMHLHLRNLNLTESQKKNIQIIRLPCRSIRIGSLKIEPTIDNVYVPLYLTVESITFPTPILYDSGNTIINITFRSADITKIWVHFGRSLPIIMFIFTTATIGEDVRNALRMISIDKCYFDPKARNDKIQKITVIIDSMTDEQCNFIRHCFFGDKVKEIDQKEANEILLKSTPNPFQNILIDRRLKAENKLQAPVELKPLPSESAPDTPLLLTPAFQMLMYPAPPQTGGIVVTFNDFFRLNNKHYLNDSLIEFYIRYFFNERLTPIQQEGTHIFNSFFYSCLIKEPVRPLSVIESRRDTQVRHHHQVRTWTKNTDIFSKDFIIVPVNQYSHWMLAVICFPGKVPEVTESTSKLEAKNNKPPENASSTHEQESSSESKVIIRELNNNAEGDNLNQDENSANSINSAYLVKESPVFDKLSPEATECASIPEEGARREMPCICIFDSFSFSNEKIPVALRDYLEIEWKLKKGTEKVFDNNTMPRFFMKCPQQKNSYDCGVYVLQFVESFFKNPIPYFGNPMPDLTDWFSASEISEKRQEIKKLIFSIHQTQVERANAGRVRPPPEAAQGDPNAVPQNDNR